MDGQESKWTRWLSMQSHGAQQAAERVRLIALGANRAIMPEAEAQQAARTQAMSFFAAPGDKEAAMQRARIMAIVVARNPQISDSDPVIESLFSVPGIDPSEIANARRSAYLDADNNQWTGPGWSPSEKAKLGREPGTAELSPGDFLAHQRARDYEILKQVAHVASLPDDSFIGAEVDGSRQTRRLVFDGGGRSARLKSIADTYDRSVKEGEQAWGWLGSNYPQHQGIRKATGVALTSPASTVGQYVLFSQLMADTAAHAAMTTSADPIDAASATYQANDTFGRPSPSHVPEGTWQERQAYIDRAKGLIEKSRPPNYSLSYARQHGEPPSYAWQGLANLANQFIDPSLPAFWGAGRAVNLMAKGLAKTSIPVVSQYGAHIAKKTLPIAGMSPAAYAMNEVREEIPLTGTLQGVTTAGDKQRPAVSNWFSPGWDNRPDLTDLKAALMGEGVDIDSEPSNRKYGFNEHYDKEMEERADSIRKLAEINRQVPQSVLQKAGSAIGDAVGTAYGNIPAPPKQPRYTPPAWGPFLTR